MTVALVLILLSSQAPVVVLYSYVYFRDQKGREPLALLIKTFFLGALACIPAAFLEATASIQTEPSRGVGVVVLLASAFLVGLIEEGLKNIVMRWYPYRRAEFDEPYDGIMYAVSISLGFAAFENLLYVAESGLSTAVARMFTAVPMHAMCGVLMGYEMGRAKFALSPTERASYLRRSLWVPIALHGAYDFLLFLKHPATVIFALWVLWYQVKIARAAMNQFSGQIPGRTEGILLPPTPPAASATIPHGLSRATRPLWVLLALFVMAAAASGVALFSPERLGVQEQNEAWGMILLATIFGPLLLFTIRRLRAGSRFAWVIALGVFVLSLGTPVFFVGLYGLSGLLAERSREYFWTKRSEPLPV